MRSMAERPGQRPGMRAVLGALAAVFLLAPVLTGCAGGGGFRPLYATGSDGESVNSKLNQIDIQTIPSRVGQRVRNELIFENNGGALPSAPIYRLEIAIRESLASTLVRSDGEAASQIYSLDAKFKLIRIADKKMMLEGTSYGRAGFQRFAQTYANVRAREDAENRAARTVASDMRSRLAAFIATPASN
jgi:LPS-assembly lipoprotein